MSEILKQSGTDDMEIPIFSVYIAYPIQYKP